MKKEINITEIFTDKYIIKWLNCSGIYTLDDLIDFKKKYKNLRKLRNIGAKSEQIILEVLKDYL